MTSGFGPYQYQSHHWIATTTTNTAAIAATTPQLPTIEQLKLRLIAETATQAVTQGVNGVDWAKLITESITALQDQLNALTESPQPAPQSEGDIEVARYGLRTFLMNPSYLTNGPRLKSVFQKTHWENGKIEAKCLAEPESRTVVIQYGGRAIHREVLSSGHQAPHEGCECGVYATLDLQNLVRQYREYAETNVAVVAAEGSTIIGSKGMRTAAARVVAYWAPEDIRARVYQEVCGKEAQRFTDIHEMLKAYGFPEYPNPFPRIPVLRGGGGGGYVLATYAPQGFITYAGGGGGGSPMGITALTQWERIKKVMGGGATPGGLNAVAKILGVDPKA